MSLKLSASDGIKVYSVSGGLAQPHWLSDKKQRSLRKDEAYRRRIELIQDLEFPEACQRLKLTPDGQFLFATGIHPPRVRVFELSQLSLKFERHLDSEIVDFQVLTDDFSKVAFLCADRSICLHARFGSYHRTRVPAFGRDLAYAPFSAELLVVGSAPEVYRLNLSEGRFLSPMPTESPAVNACGLSPLHGLLACAGETGLLECFDARARRPIGCFNAAAAAGAAGEGLTAVRFDSSGLQCATGTSNGLVALFDLRMSKPTAIRDHMYGQPIRDIKFHQAPGSSGLQGPKVISSDCHAVRVWEAATGRSFTTIEAPEPTINDVLLWPDSGLVMLGCDARHIQAYFVPALGPAPRWCSFLENLTEELEENASPTLFEDYRFVTRSEVASLGLGHLVGTALMRAYMHGYFLHNRLWQRAKALAQPLAPAALRQQRIEARLDAERASRITLVKKLPKVNAATAARLLAEKKGQGASGRDDDSAEGGLMADQRFSRMFEDPAFAIDEQSEEFRTLHPNARVKRSKLMPSETLEALSDSAADDASEDEDGASDADVPGRPAQPRPAPAAAGGKAHKPAQPPAGAKQAVPDFKGRPREDWPQQKRARMYAAGDGAGGGYAVRQREMLLADRADMDATAGRSGRRGGLGGSKQLTFVPRKRGGARGGAMGGDRAPAGGARGRGRGRGRGRVSSADRGKSRGGRSRGRH